MKRKLFILIIMIMNFIILDTSAANMPELVTIGGKEILLTNGVPVVISERSDGQAGAFVSFEGGEGILVSDQVGIFGGSHNSDVLIPTASITLNGGTVRNIIGGGLHKSSVGKTNIIVNGGTILCAIYGGGYDGYVSDDDYLQLALTADDAVSSPVRVDEVEITINGGNLNNAFIFGGGGYSYVGKSTITLNNYTGTLSYLVAGGSNGYTRESFVNVNGGSIGVVQSVNRGSMNSAEININGGNITNAYVGGEPDPGVTGTISSANMNITGGVVDTVAVGTNGVDSNNVSIPAVDVATLNYNNESVKNIDMTTFNEDSVTKNVKLTLYALDIENSVDIPAGSKLTTDEIDLLKQETMNSLGNSKYTFDDFYTDDTYATKFDFTKEINDDSVVYMKLIDNSEVQANTMKNPDTSDVGLYGSIIAVLCAVVGIGYTIKKRRFS